jgi:hypothetical protein
MINKINFLHIIEHRGRFVNDELKTINYNWRKFSLYTFWKSANKQIRDEIKFVPKIHKTWDANFETRNSSLCLSFITRHSPVQFFSFKRGISSTVPALRLINTRLLTTNYNWRECVSIRSTKTPKRASWTTNDISYEYLWEKMMKKTWGQNCKHELLLLRDFTLCASA